MTKLKDGFPEERIMSEIKVINVNTGVFEYNDRIAEKIRRKNEDNHTLMINLMASPGAGKTTFLLRTIGEMKDSCKIGVMEADIDAFVDAEKMQRAGVPVIQVHTGGECAMDASMTEEALREFDTNGLDLLFLENVGNLVCTAEQDTGASLNVEILSIPEGDDKPLKYPLMFQVCQLIVVNKTDTRRYFNFDDRAFEERVRRLNPGADIIFLSAKTGEGFDAWIDWLKAHLIK